ncbi:hypothetical protein C1X30_28500 [Pseudomonas sp. FW305-BF6]|nr:hypothetical protein C1X28_17960 [Pseudomonas sp. FW305-BF15]PNB46861.1 hypothetical protein C1X29_26040 [Pseudomonas sp. GW456-12-10-14-LB2]PNB77425.1 hypothetical protein C1X30_28500 [Pseudomonas sp. FW305-BF6]TEA58529.1 hypothetical protein EIY71_27565 [Pseudomonas sp. CH235]
MSRLDRALSVTSLTLYAALGSRAKGVLTRPALSRWVSRISKRCPIEISYPFQGSIAWHSGF